MYFNEKEDTNIDSEFGKKIKLDFNKFKIPLIIIGIIILLIIIIMIIMAVRRNSRQYFIKLEGSDNMTIYAGTEYIEPGYMGYDNKGNSYKVNVTGNVDSNKIGTYFITYTLKKTAKTRTVHVTEAPEIVTWIHLNGDVNINVTKGSNYDEPGYVAVDTIDGDLTNNVTITGNVDTNKKGVYRIVYSVVNSSGVTTSVTRTVIVK